MTTDELILKAIEKCLEQASDPEQKRLFHWMKAAIPEYVIGDKYTPNNKSLKNV